MNTLPPVTAGAVALADRPPAPHSALVTSAPQVWTPPASAPDPLLRIALAGLKGGIGKSTSAWLILTELALLGWRALGVDADPVSQTLNDSYRRAFANGQQPPFTVISWPTGDGFSAGVDAAVSAHGANAVVVDVGGESPDMFDAAGLYVDELIVPTSPSEPDLRRLPATQRAAHRVARLHRIAFSVLLVKTQSRARDATKAREYLEGKDWPLMEAQVPDAAMYRRAFGRVLPDTGAYHDVVREILTDRTEGAAQ